jgi:sugar lactone lactonase YvrE
MAITRTNRTRCVRVLQLILTASLLAATKTTAHSADLLVADRLTNKVFRYSETGALLGLVLSDSENINQPTGLALSPDLTKLFVASAQNNRLIRYDYNYAAATATNPTIVAEGESSGLAFPNAILFSPDGSKLYVSNLGGTGVAQFNADGASAGPNLVAAEGESITQLSGLAWAPEGRLLVAGFLDATGTRGAVAKSQANAPLLANFIEPDTSLAGASGLLVQDNDLYVSGMFASNIQRFNAHTGAIDPTFNLSGLSFPQGLALSPDGNGFLAGILGFATGQGHIAHYDFAGAPVGDGVFAEPGGGGFTEATVIVVEPPLPGDFNEDRIVSAADLALWKTHFGATGSPAGDADSNGTVDGADFLIWQRQLRLAASSPAVQIPEPPPGPMIALAFLGSLITLTRHRAPIIKACHPE